MTQAKLNEQFETGQAQKFEGFDFLRAIFSIAIVALHTDLFRLITIAGINISTNLLYAYVSYLAVPVFFQISLFLFYMKSERAGIHYFMQKRLPKLLYLYLFWVILKIVFDVLYIKDEITELKNLSPRKIIEFIVSGGYSPFYFFFSLIFLLACAAFLMSLLRRLKNSQMKAIVNYLLLCFTCILVFYFSITNLIKSDISDGRETVFSSTVSNIAEWDYNPLNFLPYVFTAAIVAQEFNQGKLERLTSSLKLRLCSLFAGFLLFTLVQLSLDKTLENMLQYSRPSLVFGSWLLLYFALLSHRKAPKIIQYLSRNSLGIYAFHVFFTRFFFPANTNFLSSLALIMPGLDILLRFLITLLGAIALTELFRRIKSLRNFV